MRRFIFFTSLLLITAVSFAFFWLLNSNYSRAQVDFSVRDHQIYHIKGDSLTPFVPNGTTLSATLPGLFPSDGSLPYETYMQWFAMMQEMGLNTVRVEAIMPGNFYRALRDYNQGRTAPLYLVQGIYFDEVALKDGFLPLEPKWRRAFEKEIDAAIDAVHGHANLLESIYIFKSKPVDVSPYLLGYTMGVPWSADDIAASDLLQRFEPFEGTYFSVSMGSPFEAFLARMLDHAANYEVANYQRLSLFTVIGHSGNLLKSLHHGLELREPYDVVRHYPVIDAEHIRVQPALRSGFFVSYDIEHGDLSQAIQYHTYPVVVSGYGVPSGRFSADYGAIGQLSYIDEEAQAQQTALQYQWLRNQGVAGQFLRDWQDAWFKSSWYSKDLKVLDHAILWRDVQTYGQGYGIVSFDPSAPTGHYPDGNTSEWINTVALQQSEDVEIKVAQDAGFLHFLIEGRDVAKSSGLWLIGLDMTPNSGSTSFAPYDVTFDRPVDFVVVLDLDRSRIRNSSEVYVHSYYDATHFRLQDDTLKRRPDQLDEERTSGVFHQIYQFSDETALLYPFKVLDDNDLMLTGQLTYGNGNPQSVSYLSEADWFMGSEAIELRLPYGLLNVMSPASRMVMGDFYKQHQFTLEQVDGLGVATIRLDRLTLKEAQVANADRGILATTYYKNSWQPASTTFLWDGWTTPEFSQRTKAIFEVLKNVMKGD